MRICSQVRVAGVEYPRSDQETVRIAMTDRLQGAP